MSSSPPSRRERPNAAEEQARCRARAALEGRPDYNAATRANPALVQVMDRALVAQIERMYASPEGAHQAQLEGHITGARAGGLSTRVLEASRRPRPHRRASRGAAGGSRGGGALGSGGALGGGMGGDSLGSGGMGGMGGMGRIGGMGGMGGDSRGGVSRSGFGSLSGFSARPDPEASLGQPPILIPVFFPSGRAALRPALVANLAQPRHIYVAFIHALAEANYPDQRVGTVLALLRAEFQGLHLPDV